MCNSDTREDIQKCLNCKLARCIDCLSRVPRLTGRTQKTAVLQIDRDSDETIAVFDSLTHAQSVTGINRTSISQCLHGKLPQAGGYKWKEAKAHVRSTEN